MSFSRSGTPAPGYSYPIGTGVFTDMLVSNTVFSTYFRGDGGFLSNVNSSIPGTLPNLVVSNSLTTTNVFATIYRGDGGLLSNITASGSVSGNLMSNLNASNLAFGVISSGLIYGNLISNINSSNVVQPFPNLVVSNTGNVATLNVWRISNLANLLVSNTISATNVSASASMTIGSVTLGTNVFVFSNSSGGSNAVVMNSIGNVGISTTNPGYLLDVGTTVNMPASGGETVRSKGPLIIGNGVNDGNRFISALDSSLTNGGVRYITFGKAGSTNNQVELSYVHSADNSKNNRMDVGFFGTTVMTYLASGSVGINVTSPSANLHVIGNVYASNALTTTNVFATSLVPTYPLSFRNRIINGDFIVDQRNNYGTSTPGATPTRVIDRWTTEIAGSGRCLVGQNLSSIASPAGLTSYYGIRVTTTTTPGSGDYFFIQQTIEGINVVDLAWGLATAKPVTLSFWVYSSLTGTGGGFVRNAGETAGNYNRSYPFSYTINSTNTWEYKTVTIPGDTTGQWLSGQYDGVQVGFELWNGSAYQGPSGAWAGANYTGPSNANINYAGTLNSNLYITGVQFEAGPYATPFERHHINYTTAQCQRYYETCVARLGGYNTTGGFLRSSVYFNTKKRPKVSPTFTVISTLENLNLGSLNLDSSNFDNSSARIIASVTAAGDAYGQWKVSVDCEF